MQAAAELPIDVLAQRCAEETEKYRRQLPSDPQYCFELLRRALADDLPDAFTLIYHVYERQVLAWVYGHTHFAETGESAEYFAGGAMRAFYFSVRGAKFAGFSSLPALLAYLKLCVHTSVMQYLRDQRRLPSTSIDDVIGLSETPDLDEPLQAEDLWAQICQLLPDPHEQLLARCSFIQGLKPREISAAYPAIWSSAREVSVALYRLRSILRNSPQIRRIAEERA